jgi:hypothetical protein
LWEVFAQPVHDRFRVGIHNDLTDLRNSLQGLDNVVKKRLPGQMAIIFTGHALAVMAHGNEGNKKGHQKSYESRSGKEHP